MIFVNRSIPVQKKISLGGILAGLIIISLAAASWLPTNKFFFLAASSLFASIVIIKIDLANALLLYAATSALSFFIIPSKGIFAAYLIFFGIYGIVKFLCEQVSNPAFRWIGKLASFNGSLLIAYFFAEFLLAEDIHVNLPWSVIWLGAQIIFIIYDIIYTLFIDFYFKRLDKALSKILK